MKCVRVNVQKMEVDDFSIKGGANLKIFFDDGGKKCLMYSTNLDNIDQDVKNIITKIQVYEKSQNKALDAEDILDSFVSVIIEHDEEMMERLKSFLTRLKDDRSRLKSHPTHTGYLESLNKMKKKTFEFKFSSREGRDAGTDRYTRTED